MSTLHPSYHIWYCTSTSTWCSYLKSKFTLAPSLPGLPRTTWWLWTRRRNLASCDLLQHDWRDFNHTWKNCCIHLPPSSSIEFWWFILPSQSGKHPCPAMTLKPSFAKPSILVHSSPIFSSTSADEKHCLVGACVLWTKVSKMDKMVSWRISEAEILMNFWPTLGGEEFGTILFWLVGCKIPFDGDVPPSRRSITWSCEQTNKTSL